VSGAHSYFTTGERGRTAAGRAVALLPFVTAVAASPSYAAETARSMLSVSATVEATCLVTTTTAGAADRAAPSCSAATRAEVTVEQAGIRTSSSEAHAPAQPQVTRVTVTF